MANSPLEDLIRRFESGERNPDLLRQLNEAAWDEFHDPWEIQKPEPQIAPALSFTAKQEPNFDPEALLPFGPDTIQRFLDEREYKYWKSSWDSFLVTFNYSERTDREVNAAFMVLGRDRDIFKLEIECDRRVPAERFDRAFRLCNDWNTVFRWPMAYVAMPDLKKKEGNAEGREPASGSLVLNSDLYFAAGIPQVLFNSMVSAALNGSWEFWEKAHDEYGF